MEPKDYKFRKKSETNVCYRSIIGHDRFRSGRGRIEVGKTDRGRAKGGPLGTKNGHLWSKLWTKIGQTFGHHPGDPDHSVVNVSLA